MKANLKIKELFFNQPTKHWHFEQLLNISGLSRAQTNQWLKKLLKDNLIKRIKPRGKMPYYIAQYESPHYRNTKKFYGLTKLHESGLFDYLASFENVKNIILFGSFARSDWYEESDIDLFIYGDQKNIMVGQHEAKIHRDIQLFVGKNKEDLKRMGPGLLRSILKGIVIKGEIPLEVINHAIEQN